VNWLGNKLYGVWALLTFISVTLITLVLLVFVPGLDRRRALARCGAALIFRLWRAGPVTRGLEQLPSGPCVLIANHASYLDGIILTAALPPRFSFVIKREMTRVPLAHYLLRRLGSEFLERFDSRGNARDARRILRQAKQQQPLAFFPEGTFGAQPGLRRFHNGAFVSAVRGAVPLVPVVIQGSRTMLPAGSWLPAPGQLSVSMLPALQPEADSKAVAALIARARHSILSELNEPDLHPSSVSHAWPEAGSSA
jgi:1-acyl-sn-glycerol-3-phosphate acyltransferase